MASNFNFGGTIWVNHIVFDEDIADVLTNGYDVGMSGTDNRRTTWSKFSSVISNINQVGNYMDICSRTSVASVSGYQSQMEYVSINLKNYAQEIQDVCDTLVKHVTRVADEERAFLQYISNFTYPTMTAGVKAYYETYNSREVSNMLDWYEALAYIGYGEVNDLGTIFSSEALNNFEKILSDVGLTMEDYNRMGVIDQEKVLELLDSYSTIMQSTPVAELIGLGDQYIKELTNLVEVYQRPSIAELYSIDEDLMDGLAKQVRIDGNTVYIDLYIEFAEPPSPGTNPDRDESASMEKYWDTYPKTGKKDALGNDEYYLNTYGELLVKSIEDNCNFDFSGSAYDFLPGMEGHVVTNVHVSNNDENGTNNSQYHVEEFEDNQQFTTIYLSNSPDVYGFNSNVGESIHMSTTGEDLDETLSIFVHENIHSFNVKDAYTTNGSLEEKGFLGTYNTPEAGTNADIMSYGRAGFVNTNHIEMIVASAVNGFSEPVYMQPETDTDHIQTPLIRE